MADLHLELGYRHDGRRVVHITNLDTGRTTKNVSWDVAHTVLAVHDPHTDPGARLQALLDQAKENDDT